jgi:hypothetical protein
MCYRGVLSCEGIAVDLDLDFEFDLEMDLELSWELNEAMVPLLQRD